MTITATPRTRKRQTKGEVKEKHRLIVHLRVTHPNMTWDQIGRATGLHPKSCARIYREERAHSESSRLIEQHRQWLLEDYDRLLQAHQNWAFGSGRHSAPPPSGRKLNDLLKVMREKGKMLGLPESQLAIPEIEPAPQSIGTRSASGLPREDPSDLRTRVAATYAMH